MPVRIIHVADQITAVEADAEFLADLATFFPSSEAGPAGSVPAVAVAGDQAGKFELSWRDGAGVQPGMSRAEALDTIRARAATAADAAPGVVLRAGAVGWGQGAILVAALPGAGATSVVAWLVENGFSYIADDTVTLADDGASITGFASPLTLPLADADHLLSLGAFRGAPAVRSRDRLLIAPDRTWLAPEGRPAVGLIVFVTYERGAPRSLAPAERATYRLLEVTRTVVLPNEPRSRPIVTLAAAAPCLSLRYGHYDELAGVLDFACRTILEAALGPEGLRHFLTGLRLDTSVA